MSLAAAGCDPQATWAKTDGTDGPGVTVGTMAYSPSGGIYGAVQASGAMASQRLVAIEANYQAELASSGAGLIHGAMLGVTETAFANDDFGWVKIWGLAECRAGGASSAGAALTPHSVAGEAASATANTPQSLGIHAVDALTDNNVGTIQLCFPLNRA